MGIVYKISNPFNNKVYIGKTIRSLEERKKEHLQDSKHKNCKLYKAFAKYEANSFSFDVVESNIGEENIGERERYYISLYDSYYNGYNETFGGEGESSVDESVIIDLFKAGNNCKDIESITGHTKKTVSSVLRRNGYIIKQHTGKTSSGRNGTEVPVVYNGISFDSITELAKYLIDNEEDFFGKREKTVIQGISRNIKDGGKYYGREVSVCSS